MADPELSIPITAGSGVNVAAVNSPDGNRVQMMTPIAIVPLSSSVAEASHVLKASPGYLYGLSFLAGSTPGFLMTLNATTPPADGAVEPVECVPVAANALAALDLRSGPDSYTVGIVAVFSTTGPFVKTTSGTGFFKARVL